MDSFRARFYQRAALKRALPAESVDAQAVKRYWFSLTPDERADLLHFDDAPLAQKLHGHMTSLCRSELWCRRNLMGGIISRGGNEDEPERLKGFAFECPAETDCVGRRQEPIGFAVLPDLAAREDLFEELERRLGSAFLSGRPVLRRNDWVTIAQETPAAWPDLQQQAFKLIELAIFQSHQDAPKAVAPAPLQDILKDLDVAKQNSNARKKTAKKKAAKAAKSGKPEQVRVAGHIEHDADGYRGQNEDKAEACVDSGAADVSLGHDGAEPTEGDVDDEEQDDGEVEEEEESDVDIERIVIKKGPAKAYNRAKEPAVGKISSQDAWAAWIRKVAKEEVPEWAWMFFGFDKAERSTHTMDAFIRESELLTPSSQGNPHDAEGTNTDSEYRTVVKNTFLELQPAGSPPARPFRKSCYF